MSIATMCAVHILSLLTFVYRFNVSYSAIDGLIVISLCGPARMFTMRGFILRNSSGLTVSKRRDCFF